MTVVESIYVPKMLIKLSGRVEELFKLNAEKVKKIKMWIVEWIGEGNRFAVINFFN